MTNFQDDNQVIIEDMLWGVSFKVKYRDNVADQEIIRGWKKEEFLKNVNYVWRQCVLYHRLEDSENWKCTRSRIQDESGPNRDYDGKKRKQKEKE